MNRDCAMRYAVMTAALLLLPLAVMSGEKEPKLFPNVPGWTLLPDSTVYTPGTLWEYINGAADLFLSYQFQDLHIAYYRTSPEIEIRAEVYRHASGEDAYGMYSQERSPENAAMPFGAEGYADVGMLNFVAGPWYVKISSNQTDDQSQSGLRLVAGAIDSLLNQPHRLPAGFDLLPGDNRVPRSEQYVARDFLGYGFLSGAYLANYGTGSACQVFILPKEDSVLATSAYDAFLRVANSVDRDESDPFVRLHNPHHGPIDLVLRGNILAGIVGCPDTRTLRIALLKTLP
jgi:hypothetical protein